MMKQGTQSDISKPWPPSCDGCRVPLTEPGGLVFSPPNEHDECTKSHLCVECYGGLAGWLLARRMRADIALGNKARR